MPRTGLYVADAEEAYPASSDYDPIGHLPFAEIAHPVCIDDEPAFYDAEGLLDWMRRSHYGESPMTRRVLSINDLQPIMTSDQVEKYSRSVELLKRLGWNRPDVLEADFACLVHPGRPDELERLKALPVAPAAAWAGRRRRRSVSPSSSSSSDGEFEDQSLALLRTIRESCLGVWVATQNPVLVRRRRELLVSQRFMVRRDRDLAVERYGGYVPIRAGALNQHQATLNVLVNIRERATAGIPRCVLSAARLFDDFCALFAARHPGSAAVTFQQFLPPLLERLPRARIPSREGGGHDCVYLRSLSVARLLHTVLVYMSDADRALLCGGYCLWDPIWEAVVRRTLDVVYADSAYPVWNVEHMLGSHLPHLLIPAETFLGRCIHRAPGGGNLFQMRWTAADTAHWPRDELPLIHICDDQKLETMEVEQLTVPLDQTRFYAPFADAYLVQD